ncbi:MAG: hypothetical protein ACP5VE_10290 [Chthonomonadales bacterium]
MHPVVAGIALAACTSVAWALDHGPTKAHLAPNGMLVVNGEPRFLIGLYENPESDARLREAISGGFNLIRCPSVRAALDRVREAGAWAWVNTGDAMDLSADTEARKRTLASMVQALADHPALLIWEGPDEALWNSWYATMQETDAEIDAMRREAQANASLRQIFDEAVDRYHRALWPEWQELRSRFWAKAGKSDPHPSARIDQAAQRAARLARGLASGMRYLRRADPRHFIWLNHAPRNSVRALREFNREVDVAGCDIYPIPYNLRTAHSDLVNMRPSSVGDYTDRMRKAAPGKACAMVLQGFGWADLEQTPNEAASKLGVGRRPTQQEQRFMAWDAVIHGANAILYWGTDYLKNPQSDDARRFWQELLNVTREIRSLERFLVMPNVAPAPSLQVEEHYASNDGTGVRIAIKQAAGQFLLVIVNENPYPVAFSVRGLPAELEGTQLALVGNGHSGAVSVREHAFRDGLEGFGVRLYLGAANRGAPK